jgi:hypothetical protein
MNNLVNKIASQRDALSPAIQDLVARVGQVGLHKIAAQMRGKESLELRDVITELATKLAYQHLKQQKVAAGLASLKNLEASGSVKLSQMFQLGKQGVTSLVPKAGRAAEELAGTLGRPRQLSTAGIWPQGLPQNVSKDTLRGATRPEYPAIHRLSDLVPVQG